MQLEADNAVTSSFKLCISISAENVEQLSRKMKRARAHKPDFLELRLDYIKNLDMSKLNQVRKLLRGNEFLTIRSRSEGGKSKMSERKRISLISKGLLSLNPRFIDVEILTLIKHPQILSDIEITKTKLIASFHDLEGKKTPPSLNEILSRAPIKSRSLYAIKIVKQAKRISDNQKVLSLYSHKILKGERAPKLVAFCAGEKGADSRIRCLFLGSPFSYCSLPGEPTAAGQLDIQNMREAIAKRFPGSLG